MFLGMQPNSLWHDMGLAEYVHIINIIWVCKYIYIYLSTCSLIPTQLVRKSIVPLATKIQNVHSGIYLLWKDRSGRFFFQGFHLVALSKAWIQLPLLMQHPCLQQRAWDSLALFMTLSTWRPSQGKTWKPSHPHYFALEEDLRWGYH